MLAMYILNEGASGQQSFPQLASQKHSPCGVVTLHSSLPGRITQSVFPASAQPVATELMGINITGKEIALSLRT
jgi:hypothetical protein